MARIARTAGAGAPVRGLPAHGHSETTAKTSLGLATTCNASCTAPIGPQVYKYTHLLYATTPAGTVEQPEANPLRWSFTPSDGGVGIDPATVQYQVRLQSAAWPATWTAAGAPSGGVYTVQLYRDAIPALATDEAVFEIRFRASDHFGHAVPDTGYQARCWGHHPLAAPLEVGAGAAVTASDDSALGPLADLTR